MKHIEAFQIYPEEPKHKELKFSYPNSGNIEMSELFGCLSKIISVILSFSILVILILAFGENFLNRHGTLLFVGMIAFAVIVNFIIKFFYKENKLEKATLEARKRQKEKHEQDKKYEIERVKHEALRLTDEIKKIYIDSENLIIDSEKCLEQAFQNLQFAEQKFNEKAYISFWDSFEKATRNLGEFQKKNKQLAQGAETYYQKLAKRKHSFPIFHTEKIKKLDYVSTVLKEYSRVFSLGDTNETLSRNWEERRTREVIIEGFKTLGDAVSNLSGTIGDSIYQLKKSISSDLAKVVEEEIKTRETIKEKQN